MTGKNVLFSYSKNFYMWMLLIYLRCFLKYWFTIIFFPPFADEILCWHLKIYFLYRRHHFIWNYLQIFFVLRKKNNQITNLHVIHHSIMPVLCWIGMKFYAGGSVTFFSLLNCFIHAVMYGYYLLAACGPRVQKYLWWKKYLTALQIVRIVYTKINVFSIFHYTVIVGKCDSLNSASSINSKTKIIHLQHYL